MATPISPEMFDLILKKHLTLLNKMGYPNVLSISLEPAENGIIKNTIRLISRERSHYVLKLSAKYFCLLQDLAELYVGGAEFGFREDRGSCWQSQFIYGEKASIGIPYAPVIDADSFAAIVNNMILQALAYADWETHPILENTRTERERILAASASNGINQELLVTSIGRQTICDVLIHQMMLFVVAHEIGHAMLDHLSGPQPTNQHEFIRQESNADVFAADLIFRGHQKDIYQLRSYGNPVLSPHEWVTLTLDAITIIMAFYHGLEEAASIQPAAMLYEHMPARWRWEEFKAHCIANENIRMPDVLFRLASEHTSPEYLLHCFLAIISGCSLKR